MRSPSVFIRYWLGKFDYYCRPFKPRLLWRLFLNKIFRRQGLDILDLALGYECNMKCEHCSAQVMVARDKKKMSLIDYANLSEELDRLNVFRINITGGEPLLRKDLELLLLTIGASKRHIKIQTNGLLLTEERVLSLKRAGVNAIAMSLDFADKKEFEQFRGVSKSYQKILDNIKLVRRYGLQVSLGCVVTHQSIRSGATEKMILLAKDNGCHLLLNIAVAVGRWANKEEFLFDKEGEDRKEVERLLKKYPFVHTDHETYGCPAAQRKIYITPYGDAIPCPFLHVSFGNVKDEPLSFIREKMLLGYKFVGALYCPAAEDKTLFTEWLEKTWEAPMLPVDFFSINSKKG